MENKADLLSTLGLLLFMASYGLDTVHVNGLFFQFVQGLFVGLAIVAMGVSIVLLSGRRQRA